LAEAADEGVEVARSSECSFFRFPGVFEADMGAGWGATAFSDPCRETRSRAISTLQKKEVSRTATMFPLARGQKEAARTIDEIKQDKTEQNEVWHVLNDVPQRRPYKKTFAAYLKT
jgi:hypothetical protein